MVDLNIENPKEEDFYFFDFLKRNAHKVHGGFEYRKSKKGGFKKKKKR
jgi:hypothetical protein